MKNKSKTFTLTLKSFRDSKTGKPVKITVPKTSIKELKAAGAAGHRAGKQLRTALENFDRPSIRLAISPEGDPINLPDMPHLTAFWNKILSEKKTTGLLYWAGSLAHAPRSKTDIEDMAKEALATFGAKTTVDLDFF